MNNQNETTLTQLFNDEPIFKAGIAGFVCAVCIYLAIRLVF